LVLDSSLQERIIGCSCLLLHLEDEEPELPEELFNHGGLSFGEPLFGGSFGHLLIDWLALLDALSNSIIFHFLLLILAAFFLAVVVLALTVSGLDGRLDPLCVESVRVVCD